MAAAAGSRAVGPSRRYAPSGHVATTTTTLRGSFFKWPKGPFSPCHFQVCHRRRALTRCPGTGSQSRAGGRRGPNTARRCAPDRVQATRTGRPVIVAHAATGRADAANHGHAPDGSSSATRSRAVGHPWAPGAGISTGGRPPTPSRPHDVGVCRMPLARLRTTAQDRCSAGIGGSGKWRGHRRRVRPGKTVDGRPCIGPFSASDPAHVHNVLLWPRRAGRRAHHVSDPPVPTCPARRQGGHRHHQSRDLGPPPHGHPRRSLGLTRHRARLPRPPPRESPPPGLLRAPEYLAVRAHLPAPWQDILDLAYYSGWRKNEILGLTWDEIDEAGGVIRLSPARSKTLVGRILPISQPIAEALARRRARRDPDSPLVFHRDGIPVRRWRTAWRTACQAAGVPTRFLHDCRRTAARNLIRASVPERVAMLLTGHKSRAIFDRDNIIHEQELLDAGDQLVEYLAHQAQATLPRARPTALLHEYPVGVGRFGPHFS